MLAAVDADKDVDDGREDDLNGDLDMLAAVDADKDVDDGGGGGDDLLDTFERIYENSVMGMEREIAVMAAKAWSYRVRDSQTLLAGRSSLAKMVLARVDGA